MDIEASCVLLQQLGKKLENRKTTKEDKSSSFKTLMEKLAVIEKSLEKGRLKYIIMNLFEQQKNGWPESKSKKEGPKKLEAVRQDIEKEKFAEKGSRRVYYDDYEEQPRVAYKKREHPTSSYGNFAGLAQHNEEDNENEFDKDEMIDKVKTHFQKYMEGKGGSFKEFKGLGNSIEASELVLSIFAAVTSNSALLQKITAGKDMFAKYLFALGAESVYDYKDIVQGINKYIQSSYENDVEECQHLDTVLSEVYLKGYESNYYSLHDITLADKLDADAMEPYGARIKLGHRLIAGLATLGVSREELKQFFSERVEPLVKASDPDEVDMEAVGELRKLVGEAEESMGELGFEMANAVLTDSKINVLFEYN